MKRLAAFLAAMVLGGCSSSGSSDYAAYFQAVRESWHGSFGNGAVTRQQAAAVPYASMGVRFGDGQENLLVLGSDTGGDELWTSRAHIVVLTHDGRIRRTVGLANDLTALAPKAGVDLPPPFAALKGPVVFNLSADFADLGVYAAPIACRMTARGAETVVILGHGIHAVRVSELCRATSLNWFFTNSYWIDPENGFVWRSIQNLHPKGLIARTEIFRPPG